MPAAARAWGIGALAAAISLAFAWAPSYWGDEAASVRAASLTPSALIAFVTGHVDAAHGLYYLALHYWSGLFGFSELGTRSLSALGVGVAAALTVLIGEQLGRPRLGLLAAVLFTLMPRVTWAGAEARSYAWTAALAAASWLLFLIAVRRGRWWWLALGAVSALSVAFFLLSSTLLLGQLIYLVVLRRRAIVPLVISWAGALAAASPVGYLGWRERSQVDWIAHTDTFNAWTVIAEPWGESSWAYGIVVWLLLLAGALRWRTALRRACPEWLLLGGCWAGIPLLLLVTVSLFARPLFTARYLSFTTPGVAMLLAIAAASLGGRRLVAAVVAALLLIAVPSYVGQRMPYAKPGGSDLRELAALVHAKARTGDAIVFASGPAREALYAYPRQFAGLDDVALETPFPASGSLHDTVVPLRERGPELKRVHRLWLVVAGRASSCTSGANGAALRAAGLTPGARYATHSEALCEFRR